MFVSSSEMHYFKHVKSEWDYVAGELDRNKDGTK